MIAGNSDHREVELDVRDLGILIPLSVARLGLLLVGKRSRWLKLPLLVI